MPILISHRQHIQLLEHARVFMDEKRVVYAIEKDGVERVWSVPTANSSVLLLGNGTSLSQAAARRLAEDHVMVAFVGGGGTPLLLGYQSDYRPTALMQAWIGFWPRAEARLRVARYLAAERCAFLERAWRSRESPFKDLDRDPVPADRVAAFRRDLLEAPDVGCLLSAEGRFAKALYAHTARLLGTAWEGRNEGAGDKGDRANRLLDHGNHLAYGLASATLWALGLPPSLPVTHGATRAGGLVFDLADVVKDAIVLPRAFSCAATKSDDTAYRAMLIADFDRLDVLPLLFSIVQEAARIGGGGDGDGVGDGDRGATGSATGSAIESAIESTADGGGTDGEAR